MRRILIGLIALAVLAAGGWLGFNLYVQHRATAEVEAMFDQIRARGAKASHGRMAFDLATRTLTIEDIAIEPGQQPQAHVRIASLRGTGVRRIDETRVSADSIEIAGLDVALEDFGAAKLKATYKIPQITLRDYSGPVRVQGAPASDSLVDMYRFVLEQYAAITASSVVAPTLTVSVDAGNGAGGSGDIVYSGLEIQNLGEGKIDAMKADHATFTFNVPQPGKQNKLTGELSTILINDFDSTAIAAALDPQKTSDDSYHRVYRQVSTGPYVVTSTQGVRMQIDGVAVDDIAVQPSKFRPAEIFALVSADRSTPPTPAQSRDMLEKLAGFYEGLRVGKIEIGNLSMATPQGTPKIKTIRYQQGELAIEGVDTPSPQGQFKMERFALKSFSAANLMRWAANVANPGQAPSPDQMLALFWVLEGAEIKGVVSPYKNARQLVTIDTISLNWGHLIGSIPSKANLVVKMVAPTDPANPRQMPLTMAGIDKLAIDLDVGAAWTETSSSFALAPATIDLGNLAKAQARVALGNVPRSVFTSDLTQAIAQAGEIEAGTVEFSLHDNGIVDLAVAQFARTQNVGRDAARQAIIDGIKAQRGQVAAANPDAGAAVDAIASFVQTPGQTLALKLTPLGKVPVLQLIELLKTEPIVALAQFRIEASTGM
ncbi:MULTISPECIES: hypothetical protein [unclassified Bradyrhizobium]|uniref:hypothetical protein n=1 Tax=unclassified Bradyrhizobium TaxID=2631580 RepID=UPI00247AE073|nr:MULTISPECIES: hypothetical protein [unclassified Bradyrhizobium]WGR68263.1 hypothetical protein MTX24_22765 [Bradyrhizobium sp. ISRA426]WGR80318.1 hypothetical protein MTX21_07880 [Bradyrhizobium sp. ISRA430]WGR83503.1 hypothetical protein MTX25_22445 [Bradyrhizobium sp. ISRA432]